MSWSPPSGTLGHIVSQTRQRIEALLANRETLERAAAAQSAVPAFASALRRANVTVIAEVKRRSPSKGWINAEISAPDQAVRYETGGAAAISVLTEPDHFGGSIDDVVAVRSRVRVPVLKKDFHVDPIQLLEAKALGASAALLIARALSPADLPRMCDAARELGLETLVEIRDEEELRRALGAGAAVIGINNRNLETLVIDPSTAIRLLGAIPSSVIAIAESGVNDRSDVERFAAAGADAVLVGSAVSSAPEPADMVALLASVARLGRNG